MVNNPLSILWTGKCTIYEFEEVVDQDTCQTTLRESLVLVDEPCRLSHSHEQATDIQNGAAVVSQSVILFIRPDVAIKPGSVIEVTQNGVKNKYKRASKPSIYTNHQEVALDLYEDNA